MSWFLSLILLLLIAIVLIGIILNKYVIKKYILSQFTNFSSKSKVRNVDCLIIGEPVKIESLGLGYDKSYIQICIPGICEGGAFQILRKTHSILKSDGEVLIALKEKHLDNERIKPMETLLMSDITIKRLGLEKISQLGKNILFVQPIACIKLLRNRKETGYKEIKKKDTPMSKFCSERGYSIKYYGR